MKMIGLVTIPIPPARIYIIGQKRVAGKRHVRTGFLDWYMDIPDKKKQQVL